MTTHATQDSKEGRAFYIYTPADGNEDGLAFGYTLGEAKEVARWLANNLREVGLDSAALVNRIDNGNCEWSCG
jgi:hypothetical protein